MFNVVSTLAFLSSQMYNLNNVTVIGMVERCNQSIEECIKKIMVSQEDWKSMLPCVLFALQISKHSSSSMSPYRVLYQRDPILPFQFMDQLKNSSLNSASDCLNLPESDDPVCYSVEKLEEICKNIFSQTYQNVKKAQKHQAKCYNARHSGIPFKIGEKVLKRNMRDASHKQKMRNNYTGPYQITGISSNGQYYLKDKYNHHLKRPVPANQVLLWHWWLL